MSNISLTIHTDTELVGKVNALADSLQRSSDWIVEDALRQFLANQEQQIEGIKLAIAAMDTGEDMAHETVMAEMEALLASHGG